MVTLSGWRGLMALRPTMVDFERRGFRTAASATRSVLEGAGAAFLTGFNLELATPAGQAPILSALPEAHRGFAAEGAAMAAVLLDRLNPAGGRRFAALAAAHRDRYVYLLYVGGGWALAKLHRRRLGNLGVEEPLLRWLAYDGLGFCRAFFASERGMRQWVDHRATCDPTCEIQYQGLGRSLWFRECGDPEALAARVATLPERHQGDVWSGIALAAGYAGGVEPDAYARLHDLAGEHRPAAAQGAAFAAEAWQRSGYAPAHAHTAVRVLAGAALADAAEWTWQARREVEGPDADATSYRRWRQRIQAKAMATT